MNKPRKISIAKLVPDDKNANTGTPRGQAALEHSLRTFGAGRSVLVDKDDRIIAGNKTVETAGSIGMMDAVVVETNGDQIVVVKRTDVSLDSPQGRGLAIADNRAGELNLEWNQDVLAELGDDIDLAPYFFNDDLAFGDVEPFDEKDDSDGLPFETLTFHLTREQADTVSSAFDSIDTPMDDTGKLIHVILSYLDK